MAFLFQLCGMCGNFDGNRLNDFALANGEDLSSQLLTDMEKSALVGNSYVVQAPDSNGL